MYLSVTFISIMIFISKPYIILVQILFFQELKSTFEELEMPVSDAEVRDMLRECGIQHGRIFFEGNV